MGNAASVRHKRYKHQPHRHPALLAQSAVDYGKAESLSEFEPRAMAPSRSEVARKRSAARRAIREILDQETAECAKLWTLFEEQLRGSFPHWQVQKGQEEAVSQTKAFLLAAVMVHDSTQVGIAMQRAAGLGLKHAAVVVRGLYKTLEDLLSKEDAHGLWMCLASALAEGDAMGMCLWMEEAQEKKLVVPQPVHDYILAESEGLSPPHPPHGTSSKTLPQRGGAAENVRITEWNYQEVFEDRVIEAYSQKDGKELKRLADEARHFGGDPSMAEAALVALEEDLVQAKAATAGGSVPAQRFSAPDPELSALRSTSVSALKAELGKFGADLRGVVEKEELVKMLQAMRRTQSSPNMGSSNPENSHRTNGEFGSFSRASDHMSREPSGDRSSGRERHSSRSGRERSKRHERHSRNKASGSESRDSTASPPKRPSQSPPPFWHAASREQPRATSTAQESFSPGPGNHHHKSHTPPPPGGSSGPSPSSSSSADPSRPAAPPKQSEASRGQPPPPPPAAKASPMSRAEALRCLEITSSDPTADDIRKAYKQAALKWHPDRQHNHERKEEATKKFQETRTAFEFLRNGVGV
mmetsp:Transcript_67462/g.161861  ORF Transcript_67462/g.161861 Transcript_67462/m.161861 type:complete len:584 (+) Transcript_67462:104-1855(+)